MFAVNDMFMLINYRYQSVVSLKQFSENLQNTCSCQG